MKKTLFSLISVVLVFALLLGGLPHARAAETGFLDIMGNAWYVRAVKFVSENGYMVGTGDGCFRPHEPLDRATFVVILYRFAGSPAVAAERPFSDVPEDCDYDAALTWAAERKIVRGVGGGEFAPERTITREELACMVIRYLESIDSMILYGDEVERYICDLDQSSAFAQEAMYKMRDIGLYRGRKEDRGDCSNSHAGATRAEAAAVLYRMAKKMEEMPGPAELEYFRDDGTSVTCTLSPEDTMTLFHTIHGAWNELDYTEMTPTYILTIWGREYRFCLLEGTDEPQYIINYHVNGKSGAWKEVNGGQNIAQIMDIFEQCIGQ